MRAIRPTRIEGLILPPGIKGKKRAPYSKEEQEFQKTAVLWLRYVLPKSWRVHHSRNGGMSKAENGRARAMGCLRGFMDLIILGEKDIGTLLPHKVPWVWLLELKVGDGQLSKDQRELRDDLRKLGFPVETAWTMDEVREQAKAWRWPIREVGWGMH